MAGEIEFIAFLFFAIIIIIVLWEYQKKKWDAMGNVINRHEKIKSEAVNVQASLNKYKRELNRAREILALGLQIAGNTQGGMSNSGKELPVSPQYQMNFTNIYSLLIEVLRTMRLAEDDLMYSIERFNTHLTSYNAYIQTPVFPQIAASSLQVNVQSYDGGRLNAIHQQLDTAFIEVNALENNISRLIGERNYPAMEEDVLVID